MRSPAWVQRSSGGRMRTVRMPPAATGKMRDEVVAVLPRTCPGARLSRRGYRSRGVEQLSKRAQRRRTWPRTGGVVCFPSFSSSSSSSSSSYLAAYAPEPAIEVLSIQCSCTAWTMLTAWYHQSTAYRLGLPASCLRQDILRCRMFLPRRPYTPTTHCCSCHPAMGRRKGTRKKANVMEN
ncbi:Os10g0123600 [Oryza sativa Japonica Group]|uniref:Os10g0123600 protein n=1 Tax=Oryza sativa subsp. japonica TaxID=39947 RepID=A0A0P0XR27_ORYSJ|nr:Os10g0123600 [Oryza sativa Japonica Group]